MNNMFFLFVVFFSTLLITEVIRRYSLKNNFLDKPNDRSLHTKATPHGGGLSIVIVFLICVGFYGFLPRELAYAIIGSGLLVSSIGLWDDLKDIATKWRLLVQFISAVWIIYWLDDFYIFESIIIVFILVWLLNLFNFMDGIDGIAGSEAIFVLGGGAYFLSLNGFDNLSFISLILASAVLGFLVLNWSPAKIFMGDVASGFIGLMIGVIAYTSIVKGMEVWSWIILYGIFIVDTGITLVVRAASGEKWYQAHCSHAYQHAAKKWGHQTTTISVILINLFWLLPNAIFSFEKPEYAQWFTLISLLPLIFISLYLKAGKNQPVIARKHDEAIS